jgi:AraC-like DNA-binding protein
MWLTDRRHGPLVILLALCAVQGLIISLAQHYRVPGFIYVQPITATLVAPMAWVAFQSTAIRGFRRSDYLHLAGPICAVLFFVTVPILLDMLIPALFLGYGVAVLWLSLKGADALPRLRLEAGDLPGKIWQVMGAALIASAFSDVLILVAQMLGAGHWQPWIISIYSSVMLMVLGALSLSNALISVPMDQDDTPEVQISDQDVQIVDRLGALMNEKRLYLNPDLTLSQLSRRMLVPTKQLSGAINRVTGENVSRYINAARIQAAQHAMSAGENITSAMLSSGFNTKSNFNREFLRVSGQSPTDWLNSHV